jgi:hypothetical protein
MSRDKSTEATMRMLQQQPQPQPVEVAIAPAVEPVPTRKPKVVSESSARTMVYLPLAWKEKFREIAYHERRKENDLSLEAFRDFLIKKGHKVDG